MTYPSDQTFANIKATEAACGTVQANTVVRMANIDFK